ncbi:MAG: hypothetical protein WBA17_01715 [Saprospiraceae bacterium]
MLAEFKALTPDEQRQLFDAIPLITILVAGADGNMDEDEKHAAEKIAKIRGFTNSSKLMPYYEEVGKNFMTHLEELFATMPRDVETRQPRLIERLALLNPILAKLSPWVAYYFYKDFISFAHHVAEASGGFMRYLTVGPQEAKVIDLHMIHPIAEPEEKES